MSRKPENKQEWGELFEGCSLSELADAQEALALALRALCTISREREPDQLAEAIKRQSQEQRRLLLPDWTKLDGK